MATSPHHRHIFTTLLNDTSTTPITSIFESLSQTIATYTSNPPTQSSPYILFDFSHTKSTFETSFLGSNVSTHSSQSKMLTSPFLPQSLHKTRISSDITTLPYLSLLIALYYLQLIQSDFLSQLSTFSSTLSTPPLLLDATLLNPSYDDHIVFTTIFFAVMNNNKSLHRLLTFFAIPHFNPQFIPTATPLDESVTDLNLSFSTTNCNALNKGKSIFVEDADTTHPSIYLQQYQQFTQLFSPDNTPEMYSLHHNSQTSSSLASFSAQTTSDLRSPSQTPVLITRDALLTFYKPLIQTHIDSITTSLSSTFSHSSFYFTLSHSPTMLINTFIPFATTPIAIQRYMQQLHLTQNNSFFRSFHNLLEEDIIDAHNPLLQSVYSLLRHQSHEINHLQQLYPLTDIKTQNSFLTTDTNSQKGYHHGYNTSIPHFSPQTLLFSGLDLYIMALFYSYYTTLPSVAFIINGTSNQLLNSATSTSANTSIASHSQSNIVTKTKNMPNSKSIDKSDNKHSNHIYSSFNQSLMGMSDSDNSSDCDDDNTNNEDTYDSSYDDNNTPSPSLIDPIPVIITPILPTSSITSLATLHTFFTDLFSESTPLIFSHGPENSLLQDESNSMNFTALLQHIQTQTQITGIISSLLLSTYHHLSTLPLTSIEALRFLTQQQQQQTSSKTTKQSTHHSTKSLPLAHTTTTLYLEDHQIQLSNSMAQPVAQQLATTATPISLTISIQYTSLSTPYPDTPMLSNCSPNFDQLLLTLASKNDEGKDVKNIKSPISHSFPLFSTTIPFKHTPIIPYNTPNQSQSYCNTSIDSQMQNNTSTPFSPQAPFSTLDSVHLEPTLASIALLSYLDFKQRYIPSSSHCSSSTSQSILSSIYSIPHLDIDNTTHSISCEFQAPKHQSTSPKAPKSQKSPKSISPSTPTSFPTFIDAITLTIHATPTHSSSSTLQSHDMYNSVQSSGLHISTLFTPLLHLLTTQPHTKQHAISFFQQMKTFSPQFSIKQYFFTLFPPLSIIQFQHLYSLTYPYFNKYALNYIFRTIFHQKCELESIFDNFTTTQAQATMTTTTAATTGKKDTQLLYDRQPCSFSHFSATAPSIAFITTQSYQTISTPLFLSAMPFTHPILLLRGMPFSAFHSSLTTFTLSISTPVAQQSSTQPTSQNTLLQFFSQFLNLSSLVKIIPSFQLYTSELLATFTNISKELSKNSTESTTASSSLLTEAISTLNGGQNALNELANSANPSNLSPTGIITIDTFTALFELQVILWIVQYLIPYPIMQLQSLSSSSSALDEITTETTQNSFYHIFSHLSTMQSTHIYSEMLLQILKLPPMYIASSTWLTTQLYYATQLILFNSSPPLPTITTAPHHILPLNWDILTVQAKDFVSIFPQQLSPIPINTTTFSTSNSPLIPSGYYQLTLPTYDLALQQQNYKKILKREKQQKGNVSPTPHSDLSSAPSSQESTDIVIISPNSTVYSSSKTDLIQNNNNNGVFSQYSYSPPHSPLNSSSAPKVSFFFPKQQNSGFFIDTQLTQPCVDMIITAIIPQLHRFTFALARQTTQAITRAQVRVFKSYLDWSLSNNPGSNQQNDQTRKLLSTSTFDSYSTSFITGTGNASGITGNSFLIVSSCVYSCQYLPSYITMQKQILAHNLTTPVTFSDQPLSTSYIDLSQTTSIGNISNVATSIGVANKLQYDLSVPISLPKRVQRKVTQTDLFSLYKDHIHVTCFINNAPFFTTISLAPHLSPETQSSADPTPTFTIPMGQHINDSILHSRFYKAISSTIITHVAKLAFVPIVPHQFHHVVLHFSIKSPFSLLSTPICATVNQNVILDPFSPLSDPAVQTYLSATHYNTATSSFSTNDELFNKNGTTVNPAPNQASILNNKFPHSPLTLLQAMTSSINPMYLNSDTIDIAILSINHALQQLTHDHHCASNAGRAPESSSSSTSIMSIVSPSNILSNIKPTYQPRLFSGLKKLTQLLHTTTISSLQKLNILPLLLPTQLYRSIPASPHNTTNIDQISSSNKFTSASLMPPPSTSKKPTNPEKKMNDWKSNHIPLHKQLSLIHGYTSTYDYITSERANSQNTFEGCLPKTINETLQNVYPTTYSTTITATSTIFPTAVVNKQLNTMLQHEKSNFDKKQKTRRSLSQSSNSHEQENEDGYHLTNDGLVIKKPKNIDTANKKCSMNNIITQLPPLLTVLNTSPLSLLQNNTTALHGIILRTLLQRIQSHASQTKSSSSLSTSQLKSSVVLYDINQMSKLFK